MGKKATNQVDKAKPYIKAPRKTDKQKVSVTRSVTTSMQGSPAWNSDPALQAASTVWNQRADAIEAGAKVVSDLHSKLKTAEGALLGLRRDWSVATQHMVATVAIHCNGSADEAVALGFDVQTRAPKVPQTAPADLAVQPGKAAGEVVATWSKGTARNGFIVQHATDVANPATIAAPAPSTRPKFTLKGAQSLSTVFFRVAAIDPMVEAGRSDWSAWVSGSAK